jgi:ABC-type transport system substrate-binding protein
LLTAAGIPEGTELTLLQSTGSNPAMAELFQANLAEIGITLSIEPVDQGTRAATFCGDTPAEEWPNFLRWSWWPDYNDAWNVLYPTMSCDAWGAKGANGGFYCNEEVDALLAEAKDASTLESYTEILVKYRRSSPKLTCPTSAHLSRSGQPCSSRTLKDSPSTPSTSAPTTSGRCPGRRRRAFRG